MTPPASDLCDEPERFQDNRITDLGRGGRGGVEAPDLLRPRELDAGTLKKLPRLEVPVSDDGRIGDRLAGHAPGRVLLACGEAIHHRDGSLDVAVDRNAVLLQGAGRFRRPVHQLGHERAAGGLRDTPEAAGNLDLPVPGFVAVTAVPAKISGEEHGVDLSGIEEDGGGAFIRPVVLRAGIRQVHRIEGRCSRREHTGKCRADLVAQAWNLEATGGGLVAGDDAVATAVCENPEAPSANPATGQEAGSEVDDLLRRVDPEDAGRLAGSPDGPGIGEECPRMGPGGGRAGLRAAGVEEEDRLAPFGRLGRRERECSTVAEVLAVDRDQPRRRVPSEIGDHLGELEIGLVAE